MVRMKGEHGYPKKAKCAKFQEFVITFKREKLIL